VTSEAADKAVTESVGGSTFLQDEINLLDSACLDLERVQAKVSSFFETGNEAMNKPNKLGAS